MLSLPLDFFSLWHFTQEASRIGATSLTKSGAWAAARPHPRPPPLGRAMQRLATASHRLLYLCMLLSPLSGFLGSVFSGYPIRFFGLRLPQLAERWDAAKELLSCLHLGSAYALMLLIGLHLLAFFHHQFILKDGLLQRMLLRK